MKLLRPSSALKADAREMLLGKYKVAVLSYALMELLITSILTFVEMQINLQTTAGILLYYAIYLIIVLLSTVIVAGQNYLYLNMYRGQKYETGNIWAGFRICADKAILSYVMIFGKTLLCSIPCMVATAIMLVTENYYLVLLVAATAIYMIIAGTLIQLDYSQVLYLIWDFPQETASQLLNRSQAIMKGHRGSYFYLLFSFIGMFFLSLLTFGIGMLWIYPYFTATKTAYYLELTK